MRTNAAHGLEHHEKSPVSGRSIVYKQVIPGYNRKMGNCRIPWRYAWVGPENVENQCKSSAIWGPPLRSLLNHGKKIQS